MTQEILIPHFVHPQGTYNWKPKLSFKNWENHFSNAWNIIAPLSHAIDLLSSGQLGFNLRGYVALWWFEEQPVQQSKPPSLVTHENQIIISCTGLLCCAKLLLWLSVALTTLKFLSQKSRCHCCPLNCFQVWKCSIMNVFWCADLDCQTQLQPNLDLSDPCRRKLLGDI